jgi:hypothetical protein
MSDHERRYGDLFTRAETDEEKAARELATAATEPEHYRPLVARAQPQLAFCLVEADGTLHGFPYHTMRHLKYRERNGATFVSFSSDGIAVVMQGDGMKVVFWGLQRHTLVEAREYDGKPVGDTTVRITRLTVQDTQERVEEGPRLVK